MGVIDFFTNADKAEESDVSSPAFSLTKVQAGLGAVIVAICGALPASLQSDRTVVVAAMAAGTLIMLGVFALAAVDLVARQRASEATLRWGSAKPAASDFVAIPDAEGLVLQEASSGEEYRIRIAEVKDDSVTLVARRGEETLTETFQRTKKK
jgi:hypothetical protein